jgi:hypothetical protein
LDTMERNGLITRSGDQGRPETKQPDADGQGAGNRPCLRSGDG